MLSCKIPLLPYRCAALACRLFAGPRTEVSSAAHFHQIWLYYCLCLRQPTVHRRRPPTFYNQIRLYLYSGLRIWFPGGSPSKPLFQSLGNCTNFGYTLLFSLKVKPITVAFWWPAHTLIRTGCTISGSVYAIFHRTNFHRTIFHRAIFIRTTCTKSGYIKCFSRSLRAAGEVSDRVAPVLRGELPRVQVLDLVERLLVIARVIAQVRQVFAADLLPERVKQGVAG